MNEYFRKSPEETLKMLDASVNGLSEEDINNKREQFGFNELEEGKRRVHCRFY